MRSAIKLPWIGFVLTLAVAACAVESGSASSGSSGGTSGTPTGGSRLDGSAGGAGSGTTQQGEGGAGGGATDDGGGASTGGGTPAGTPIACATPSTAYKKNGGACGSERWDVKTGTDALAKKVSLVPVSTTVANLIALPKQAATLTSRVSPTEDTLWELKDVTLTMIKLESDSDYHMVLTQGAATMIAEVPYPSCATASAWECFISNARAEVDAKYSPSSSPQYPAATVTVRGIGFYDFAHGQTGEAPNSIELHAVLQICFGKGCAL